MDNYINITVLFITNIVTLLLLAIVFALVLPQRARTKRLLKGADGTDLEKVLEKHQKMLEKHEGGIGHISSEIQKIIDADVHHFQKIAIKRFNPFKDIGGDQSFILVLLDGKYTGFVITSLYREEGTRIYAKPIVEGKPTHSLAPDEKELLQSVLSS